MVGEPGMSEAGEWGDCRGGVPERGRPGSRGDGGRVMEEHVGSLMAGIPPWNEGRGVGTDKGPKKNELREKKYSSKQAKPSKHHFQCRKGNLGNTE